MVCSAYCSTRRGRPTINLSHSKIFFPLLHSIKVLTFFFLVMYLSFLILLPFHPPTKTNPNRCPTFHHSAVLLSSHFNTNYFPPSYYQLIPCSSVCPSLDNVPYPFLSLSNLSFILFNSQSSRHYHFQIGRAHV